MFVFYQIIDHWYEMVFIEQEYVKLLQHPAGTVSAVNAQISYYDSHQEKPKQSLSIMLLG